MAGLSLNPYDLNYGQFMAGGQPVGASDPTGAYLQGPQAGAGAGVGATLATPTTIAAPSITGGAPGGMGTGIGMNLGTGQLALGALGTIGNLWMAWNAQKLASKQFDYQKGITNTNLANQIKSYNTALVDRITSRAAMQGEGQDYINDYLNDNRLRDERKNKG